GTVSIDPDTGEITYTPTSSEAGTDVTIEYTVCNDVNDDTTFDAVTGLPNANTTDDVCQTATLTITVTGPDSDGDGVVDAQDLDD
ncbi:Ig-like domain-containing protein, partial [uncultured Tenacibaculum sp.]